MPPSGPTCIKRKELRKEDIIVELCLYTVTDIVGVVDLCVGLEI